MAFDLTSDKLLNEANLIDTFRYLNKDIVKYSFWTYMFNARSKNKGWRIDYFLVSEKIINWVKKSDILTDVTLSFLRIFESICSSSFLTTV